LRDDIGIGKRGQIDEPDIVPRGFHDGSRIVAI
jgi:hypothetical protein